MSKRHTNRHDPEIIFFVLRHASFSGPWLLAAGISN
jgi:hypothetical protein